MTEKVAPDKVTARERLADQDWAEVAHASVSNMTPPQKGWILAFVILFLAFQGSNYFLAVSRHSAETERVDRWVAYFDKIEDSRAKIEENRSQEMRRMQEVNKELSQALGRRYSMGDFAGPRRDLIHERSDDKKP